MLDSELFSHFGLPPERTQRTLAQPGRTVDADDLTRRLCLAVDSGHASLVRLLLDAGADVDRPNTRGITPLYAAARSGRLLVIDTLLDAGASTSAICQGDGRSPLHGAAHSGETEAAARLLEVKADVTQRSSSGATPLHIACSRGRVEVVRLLLDASAPIDASCVDSRGCTPLHIAVECRHVEVARILVLAGADVNAGATSQLGPPLVLACMAKARKLRAPACARTSTQHGSAPVSGRSGAEVDASAQLSHRAEVSSCKESQADVNSGDNALEVVQLLLSHGAETDLAVEGTGLLELVESRGASADVCALIRATRDEARRRDMEAKTAAADRVAALLLAEEAAEQRRALERSIRRREAASAQQQQREQRHRQRGVTGAGESRPEHEELGQTTVVASMAKCPEILGSSSRDLQLTARTKQLGHIDHLGSDSKTSPRPCTSSPPFPLDSSSPRSGPSLQRVHGAWLPRGTASMCAGELETHSLPGSSICDQEPSRPSSPSGIAQNFVAQFEPNGMCSAHHNEQTHPDLADAVDVMSSSHISQLDIPPDFAMNSGCPPCVEMAGRQCAEPMGYCSVRQNSPVGQQLHADTRLTQRTLCNGDFQYPQTNVNQLSDLLANTHSLEQRVRSLATSAGALRTTLNASQTEVAFLRRALAMARGEPSALVSASLEELEQLEEQAISTLNAILPLIQQRRRESMCGDRLAQSGQNAYPPNESTFTDWEWNGGERR